MTLKCEKCGGPNQMHVGRIDPQKCPFLVRGICILDKAREDYKAETTS